ncbi:DNA cross-link repair 1A protein [Paragonimus westermani]|uniref:DNA cross-link repair 1A protein n=1 Tax=Paragonimus westermani TaxID=34504 RepID=A0A5J4NGM4_9TREM|nr:DNA cross-link repair 1A protein [Paragonimus westermani]
MKPRPNVKEYHGASLLSYFHTKSAKDKSTLTSLTSSNVNGAAVVGAQQISMGTSDIPSKTQCPFYKWIPGTRLTVDAFSYGLIDGCDGYLLSHFHSDHYKGLSASFTGTIFCSNVTKSLVSLTFGSHLKVVSLTLNSIMDVCGVDVLAMDANHCPGSVMFLFRLPRTNQFILHTGDFRFNLSMLNPPSPLADFVPQPVSHGKPPPQLHSIYLDTTYENAVNSNLDYCSSQYDFPTQDQIISAAIEVTRERLQKNSNTVVVCGMYTIGKERFVNGLAGELNLRVWLPAKQSKLIDMAAANGCPVCISLTKRTVSNPKRAQLHVVPMGQLNLSNLLRYQANLGPPSQITPFNQSTNHCRSVPILAWRPTGWAHYSWLKKKGTNNSIQTTLDSSTILPDGLRLEHSSGNIRIYGAAYSEHSSSSELKKFVSQLCPLRVQQTVFGGAASRAREQINEWLSAARQLGPSRN